MTSTHFSIRMSQTTLDELDQFGRRTGHTRSEAARTLINEGLRMEQHPGIVFRGGPAGRRAGLAAGPDVWEVARVLRGISGTEGDEALERAVALTGLRLDQVSTALRYYGEYQTEIDDWIRRVDEEADRAEAAWRRAREVLRR
jgi:hypothetical protein